VDDENGYSVALAGDPEGNPATRYIDEAVVRQRGSRIGDCCRDEHQCNGA
jgi:hypothetical protein